MVTYNPARLAELQRQREDIIARIQQSSSDPNMRGRQKEAISRKFQKDLVPIDAEIFQQQAALQVQQGKITEQQAQRAADTQAANLRAGVRDTRSAQYVEQVRRETQPGELQYGRFEDTRKPVTVGPVINTQEQQPLQSRKYRTEPININPLPEQFPTDGSSTPTGNSGDRGGLDRIRSGNIGDVSPSSMALERPEKESTISTILNFPERFSKRLSQVLFEGASSVARGGGKLVSVLKPTVPNLISFTMLNRSKVQTFARDPDFISLQLTAASVAIPIAGRTAVTLSSTAFAVYGAKQTLPSLVRKPSAESAADVFAAVVLPSLPLFEFSVQKAGNFLKTFGAERVQIETLVPENVLTGKSRFPKGKSVPDIVEQFRSNIASESEIYAFHATDAPFAKDKSFKAIRGTSPEKGLFVAPKTSPYFLRLGGDEGASFSGVRLLPEINTKAPSILKIQFADVQRLPKNLLRRVDPQFRLSTEFVEARTGERLAYISVRSEKFYSGRPGGRRVAATSSTPEAEAIFPRGERFVAQPPTGRGLRGALARIRGYEQYTIIKGEAIPIRKFRAVGSGSRQKGLSTSEFSRMASADYDSSSRAIQRRQKQLVTFPSYSEPKAPRASRVLVIPSTSRVQPTPSRARPSQIYRRPPTPPTYRRPPTTPTYRAPPRATSYRPPPTTTRTNYPSTPSTRRPPTPPSIPSRPPARPPRRPPKLPKFNAPKEPRQERRTRARKSYAPSLLGVQARLRIPKVPKRTFSGFEARAVVTRRRKK